MNSADNSLFARIGIGLTALATIVAICWVFDFNMRKGALGDPRDLSLSGEWKFHNGPIALSSPLESFSETVKVPEPLRPQLREDLKNEFWYQKSFTLPERFVETNEPLALFLGSIKGDHEIYWNGEKIGSGEKTSLSLITIPQNILRSTPVNLRVRVKKIEHLFPGIVHVQPMAIGAARGFEIFREFYSFDSGVKPLILGTFKFSLFFLFVILFISSPKRAEYFSFSIFVLCSAVASVSYSRFLPIYSDFFLRNAVTFLSTVIAICVLPWVTADILRLKMIHRTYARIYGGSLALIFVSATFVISSRELEVSLYQFAGKWLPIAVGIPTLVACLFALKKLEGPLAHRRAQIAAFAVFLGLGSLGWFLSAGSLLSFRYIPYPELWDIGLFAGLAISASMDMRFTSRRSQRADKLIPKWFSGFLASGIDQVTLEIPMVAIAVDTVGYTRLLSEMDEQGKSELHNNIRARMAPVIERFGAQKLSDRGDGALLAWDLLGNDENKRAQVRMAVAGAEYLVMESSNSVGIKFRVGVAAGLVRGELKGSELSFLGEPLNAASRLEAAARPGTVLLHESVVKYLDPATLGNDWIKIDVKGVSYRALTLAKTG
ncbi:MAG: adenylate/guanylate cyclase domain-containing protein [Bacteriovoracia bacterium]